MSWLQLFLRLHEGNRAAAARKRSAPARARAQMETREEMRQRHAQELCLAGYAVPVRATKNVPPDDDPDPDELRPEIGPGHVGSADGSKSGNGSEDEEDEAVDQEPNEDIRRARRAKLRRRRRAEVRARERRRYARIFEDAAAARKTRLAAEIAFTTDLPVDLAIRKLREGGSRPSLSERMAGYAVSAVAIGTGAGRPEGATQANGVAGSWDVAMKKARDE